MDKEWTYVKFTLPKIVMVRCNLCGKVFNIEDEVGRLSHRLNCPPKDCEVVKGCGEITSHNRKE